VVERMYEKHHSRIPIGRNRITRTRLRADLDRVYGTLMKVADGSCPHDAGLSPREIRYASWSAPARMDLALTYRCNLQCVKCYNGDRDNLPELTAEEWLEVYRRLWSLGVPQVVFTGGEPTLREDLVRLVGEADEFVTGLITNGTRLAELAVPLREASLDYVQVTLESLDPAVHDAMTRTPGSHRETTAGIASALRAGLEVTVNTTITKRNAGTYPQTLEWMRGIGVGHVACNTLICSGRGLSCREEEGISDDELRVLLDDARQVARALGLDLQWFSPTCYAAGVNPLELDFGIKACSAAAHNMLIQPDGTVLPCQSWPDSVGNILQDDWKGIWEHPTCMTLRDHGMRPDECAACAFLGSCGGGCPLDRSVRRAQLAERRS
jgi:radical SAM protein with 4Fe4S-binding SPASM domain